MIQVSNLFSVKFMRLEAKTPYRYLVGLLEAVDALLPTVSTVTG